MQVLLVVSSEVNLLQEQSILFQVFSHYLKSALKDVGYWDTDMITEDIAVSWKLHLLITKLSTNHVLYAGC